MLAAKAVVAQDFDFNEMAYTPEQTTFQLFAPAGAKSVKVRIYKEGQGGKPLKTVRMTLRNPQEAYGAQESYESQPPIWSATVKGDLLGRYYTFDTGHG